MKLLITGGTGFLGQAVVKYCLSNEDVLNKNRLIKSSLEIIVFSRDEYKQWIMQAEINDPRVKYIIGDVRDRNRVFEACENVDYIIHGAALKHVWAGELHPWEVIQTNIHGTKNIVDAANHNKAKMVLVSSDKAVEPMNLYGCTKMAAEALTINGNQRVVRYGNVFGSRGSVLHKFKEWVAKGHSFKITDMRMTRFVITIDQAVKLVLETLNMPPRALNIPTLPAMRIVDLAKAFDPEAVIEEIGIFPGEKLHESLSPTQSSEDARRMSIAEIRSLIDASL